MIDQDMRNTVMRFHEDGMSLRKIGHILKISRSSVRAIVQQKGLMPDTVRKDKINIDQELLRSLYDECDGWKQRIHEKLVEEEKIEVSYSTLTRMLRKLDLSRSRPARCDRVPDKPGLEMQHDTTVYHIKIAGKRTKVIASLIYLRYSKRRYLKFYRIFNRFGMKCFFHEALMYWGYSARQCIIDNTNLARLRGTGKNAVIAPEMVSFSERYAFKYICHALRHPNRKAGNERSFWTVETNFLPGRHFESMEDLNKQAFQWATVRMHHRPTSKTGLIPAKAFEHERTYLTKLPRHLPAPYCNHQRCTDQYGYAAFNANYYWVPGTDRCDVKVLEYSDRLKIYRGRELLAEYALPADGVSNQRFSPPGLPTPRHQPKKRRKSTAQEEKRLRAMAEVVGAYVDFVVAAGGIQRHRFLRELLRLAQEMTSPLFIRTIERALKYRITRIEIIRRIAQMQLSQDVGTLPCAQVDEGLLERETYVEGSLTDAPDFTPYDKLLEQNDGH